jgi:hypothetical protein
MQIIVQDPICTIRGWLTTYSHYQTSKPALCNPAQALTQPTNRSLAESGSTPPRRPKPHPHLLAPPSVTSLSRNKRRTPASIHRGPSADRLFHTTALHRTPPASLFRLPPPSCIPRPQPRFSNRTPPSCFYLPQPLSSRRPAHGIVSLLRIRVGTVY